MKKVRHYKRIDNALIKNMWERIFCREYGETRPGFAWFASAEYFPDRSKPCTMVLDERFNIWELIID